MMVVQDYGADSISYSLTQACAQKPANKSQDYKTIPSFGGLFNVLGFLDLMVAQFRLCTDKALRLYAGWPISLLAFLHILDGIRIRGTCGI
jgi:hypothetical protein